MTFNRNQYLGIVFDVNVCLYFYRLWLYCFSRVSPSILASIFICVHLHPRGVDENSELHTRCSPSRFFFIGVWSTASPSLILLPLPSLQHVVFYFYAACDSSGAAHPPKPSGICKLSPHPSPFHCKLFACTPLGCHDDGAAQGWAAGVPVWVSGFLIFHSHGVLCCS